MTVHTDLYELLGVAPAASAAELSKAYRAQLWRYHPDTRAGSPPSTGSDEAAEAIRNLLQAYAILRDPVRRAEYDRQRARRAVPRDVKSGPRDVEWGPRDVEWEPRDVTPAGQELDLLRGISAVRWQTSPPRIARPTAGRVRPTFFWWSAW